MKAWKTALLISLFEIIAVVGGLGFGTYTSWWYQSPGGVRSIPHSWWYDLTGGIAPTASALFILAASVMIFYTRRESLTIRIVVPVATVAGLVFTVKMVELFF